MSIGANKSSKTTEGIFPPVADITALKAVNTSQETTWKDRGSLLVEDQGSWYRLDRQSSAAESLPDIVSPTTGSGRWIKVGGISVKSTSITYAALQALVSATSLTPGAKYLISDYKTTHEIPNTSVIHNGATEAIIVRAKTTSSFEKEATSSVYTNDLLHYDFTDNLAEDGTTPRTGKITWKSVV